MCGDGSEELVLPVDTDEFLDVQLLSWADTVDPVTLAWKALISSTFVRWPGGSSPAETDPGWVSASCVNRGTLASPRYMIQVRLNLSTPGRYGLWVRVAGAAGTSPIRFAGVVRAR